MMAGSTSALQSEAGYIDARPQIRQIDENLLRRTAGPYMGSRRACARALRARHRGCLQGRERSAVIVADGGLGDGGAAVGGLPGLRQAGSERIRARLSVRRWHCRAAAT